MPIFEADESASKRDSSLPESDGGNRQHKADPERVAIIGAGPLGLETAHYAVSCGFAVRVFEADAEIAPRVRLHQHLGMFCPWGHLRTRLGEAALTGSRSRGKAVRLPSSATYPTGADFLQKYLEPMAAALPDKSLWLGHRVVGVTRAYLLPDDHAELPALRGSHPFRILTRNTYTGEERAWSAEYVMDCTSGGRVPAWIGSGGLPAIGEMGCTHKIFRHTPDIGGRDRGLFSQKKTLLIGDGTSAAISAVLLSELAESQEGTQIYWAVKSDGDTPCRIDPQAQVSSRRSLMLSKANLLVKSAKPYLAYSRRTQVEEIRYNIEAKKFYVTVQADRQTKRYQFDNVIANVGSRRDATYLKQVRPDEMGFFEVGAADYSSCETALRCGHGEIRDIFQKISGDRSLDLYGIDAKAA